MAVRPLIRNKKCPPTRPGVGDLTWLGGVDLVAAAVSAARTALNLHSSYGAAQSLLIEDTPAIDGRVTDEGRTGDGTAFLGGRATSFDGVDQRAMSLYADNGNFKQIDNDNDATSVRFIFRAPTAAGNQNFWSFQTAARGGMRLYGQSSSAVRLQWIQVGGASTQISTSETTWPLMDGEWHEVTAVFDGSDMILYIDGREAYRTASTTLAASSDENMTFAASESGNSDFGECDILTWQLWKGTALTAANVRDLYLNRFDLATNIPDVSFLFDGPDIYDQGSAQLDPCTLGGTTDPALVEDGDVPCISTDLNALGYTVNGSSQNIPKRLGTALDAEGNTLQYTGPLRRDAQLENGPCLELDSTNKQYIEIPNSDTFDSTTDWTLTGEINFTTVIDQRILTQAGGSSYMYLVCRNTGSGPEWNSWLDGSWIAWNLITAPATGKDYKITLTKSGTSLTFTVENRTDGTTETQTKTETVDSRSGNFFLGSNRAGTANHVDAKLWNWKLDHANGFELPLAEGSGTTAFDVSGNGKHGTLNGITTPTYSTQDRYFYNENKGFTNVSGVLVPALADGSEDAQGNAIGSPAGPWIYDTGVTISLAPVANTQWINHRWQNAEFNATSSYIALSDDFTWDNDFAVELRANVGSAGVENLLYSGSNGNYRIQVNGTDLRAVLNGNIVDSTNTYTVGTESLFRVEHAGGASADVTLTIDEASEVIANASTPSHTADIHVGANNTLGAFYDGTMRNLLVDEVDVTYADIPLAGNSLDLSANCNHGTDTDITYNKNIVTSWAFGDTASLPMSVTAAGSTESEFISFTAGVPA